MLATVAAMHMVGFSRYDELHRQGRSRLRGGRCRKFEAKEANQGNRRDYAAKPPKTSHHRRQPATHASITTFTLLRPFGQQSTLCTRMVHHLFPHA
jgi:hypothetical protein